MKLKDVFSKANRYVLAYVIATVAFLIVILFIDPFNLFEQIRLSKSLKEKKQQVEYYEQEVPRLKQQLEKIKNDTATWEKVAREQYLMKRDNEVTYLIETQQ